VIWSSTWVAIKIGLEDCPPLLGAGIRFAFAGLLLLGIAAARRRSLRTDGRLTAILALLPFALAYGLVYWGEQYIPSGLAAVLFGILPLYTALLGAVLLPDEPLRARLVVGILVAIGGLALAFAESADAGDPELALAGAAALALAPLGSALGNIAQKLRARSLEAVVLNGWAMLGGGLALLAVSGLGENWSELALSAETLGSIAYLAVAGSAVTFVGLTLLLRHISAQAMSFLALLLPFGALVFGAVLYGEDITLRALGGAALVGAGLLVAQGARRSGPRDESLTSPAGMSYAIVRVGGKQYRVEKGDSIVVDRLRADEGAKVDLEPLMYADGDKSVLDPGQLGKVKVRATVTGHERGKKIHGLKFKPKKGYKRRYGHRQDLTRLEIADIKVGASKRSAKKEDSDGS
jgi:ribosomal protein L21